MARLSWASSTNEMILVDFVSAVPIPALQAKVKNSKTINAGIRPNRNVNDLGEASDAAEGEEDEDEGEEKVGVVDEEENDRHDNGDDVPGLYVCDRFHPEYTYPFYGEDELISGYLQPKLRLRFSAHTLETYLSISHSAVANMTSGPLVPQDLLDVLPGDLLQDDAAFALAIRACVDPNARADTSAAPGKLVAAFETSSPASRPTGTDNHATGFDEPQAQYELYTCDFNDATFRRLYKRMRILPLLFIEGAVLLDETDPRWHFLLAYLRPRTTSATPAPLVFAGMLSSYAYYMFPDKERRRVSQLLVLPAHRRRGIAAKMYACVHQMVVEDPKVFQLAIEDPSDVMDAIRDTCDLRALARATEVGSISFSTVHSESISETAKQIAVKMIRKTLKLHPRQAERIYEMWILLKVLENNQNQIPSAKYRVMVKARLYRANAERLRDVAPRELKERLQETYEAVLDEYRQRLDQYGSGGT